MGKDSNFIVGTWRIEPALDRMSDGAVVLHIRRQIMELLVYLAGRPNDVVSSDELLADLWRDRVVTSASVYNCITELRRALDQGTGETVYIETIPRRGYRLVAPVSGPGVTGLREAPHRMRRHLARAALVVLLVVAAYFATDFVRDDHPALPLVDDKSIAVLPFENMSSDSDLQYLSDGLTEEILNSLARLPDLKVAARTSAFYFKGKGLPVSEIAKRLRVKYVLEGTMRIDGDRLRVVAQLNRAEDGFHVWSDSYDASTEDIISVQESIAGQVAVSLNVMLDEPKRKAMSALGTVDVDAYKYYLKGRELLYRWLDSGSIETIWQAKDFVDRAIEADARFAPAYALRTHIYFQYIDGGIPSPIPPTQDGYVFSLQKALDTIVSDAQRAASYSRDRGLEHMMLVSYSVYSGDFAALPALAEEIDPLEIAATQDILDPYLISVILSVLRRTDKAIQLAEYRLQRNRLNPLPYNEAWRSYYMAGDTDKAFEHLDHGFETTNRSIILEHNLLMACIGTGQVERALQLVERPRWGIPAFHKQLRAFAYAAAGRSNELRNTLQDLIRESEPDGVLLAIALRENGQETESRQMFERLDERPGYHGSFLALATELQGKIAFDLSWTPRFAAKLDEAGISFGTFELPVTKRDSGETAQIQ